MDRKDYQYIHNSLGKNNQLNAASRANNYVRNLFPPLNKQNIIIDQNGSGIYNGQLQIYYDSNLKTLLENKVSGIIFHDYDYNDSVNDGALVFCARLQANTTYILNCLNRYRINGKLSKIQAFTSDTSTPLNEFKYFTAQNIGNSETDSYCYFYNKDECLMAFYIPNCAPADKIQINNDLIIMTNIVPPLKTAVQLVASDIPYTIDDNEQITGINNITPYSTAEFENNTVKLEDVINILNNTPVQFEIDTTNNIIKIPQITNQTVVNFLKSKTYQPNQGEPTYPRYQLVLIPWRDFLKERECSNRKSRWENNADGTRNLINTYKTFNTRYTCLYGHPVYGNENFDHLHSILLKCNMPFIDQSITCLQNTETAYKIILNSHSIAETGQCLIHPQKFKNIVEVKHNPDDIEYFVKGNYINPIYKQKETNGEYTYKRPIMGYMEPLAIANRLEKGCALANNTYETLEVPYGWKKSNTSNNSTQLKKTITYRNYAAISFSWGLIDLSYKNDSDMLVSNLNFLNDPMYKIPFTNLWWKIFPEIEPHKFLPSMSKPILVPFKSQKYNSLDYDYQAKEDKVENTNYEVIDCIKLT